MTTQAATLPAFEIFAPGRHASASGETLSFAASDLAATAGAYDPAVGQAPICVGHPANDAPAYGWIKSLTMGAGRLVAEPEQVDPAFAAMVEAGRFKMRSACFFRPDSPNNPVPGTWYLRHVAFLGAAAPAVPGLKPIAFSAGDDGTVQFSAPIDAGRLSWSLRSIGQMLGSFRDWLIAKEGVEAADKVIPSWRIDDLAAGAGRLEADPAPAFASLAPPEQETDMSTAPDAAELARREADLAKREAAFAAQEAARIAADNGAFLDSLVQAGKLPSGLKDECAAFMSALPTNGDTVSFAAPGGGTIAKTPAAAFRDLLGKLPQLVDFGERAPAERQSGPAGSASFAAAPGFTVDPERLRLHQEAQAYATKHNCAYDVAVKAVGG